MKSVNQWPSGLAMLLHGDWLAGLSFPRILFASRTFIWEKLNSLCKTHPVFLRYLMSCFEHCTLSYLIFKRNDRCETKRVTAPCEDRALIVLWSHLPSFPSNCRLIASIFEFAMNKTKSPLKKNFHHKIQRTDTKGYPSQKVSHQ